MYAKRTENMHNRQMQFIQMQDICINNFIFYFCSGLWQGGVLTTICILICICKESDCHLFALCFCIQICAICKICICWLCTFLVPIYIKYFVPMILDVKFCLKTDEICGNTSMNFYFIKVLQILSLYIVAWHWLHFAQVQFTSTVYI